MLAFPFRHHRATATAALLAAIGALAALPAPPASAGSPTVTTVDQAQLEALLDKAPLSALSTGQLVEQLGGLPALGGLEAEALDEALASTIESLKASGGDLGELLRSPASAAALGSALSEALGPLGSVLLETLLKGAPTEKLEEALGSVGTGQLVGELLSGAGEPQKLLSQALGGVSPSAVEGVLGTTLAGQPFVLENVGKLASTLETTPQALAEQLGLEPSKLPGSAMALLAPLADGKQLGVLDGVGGVNATLLGKEVALGEGSGKEGSGGSSGAGRTGGGSTITVIHTSAGEASPPGGAGASTNAQSATRSTPLRVLAHRVRGRRLSVLVLTPGAGTVSLSGKGVGGRRREVARAERVWLRTTLDRASVARLRRHPHRRLTIPIRLAFRPVGGSLSAASFRAAFR